jgi:hypothetical protein
MVDRGLLHNDTVCHMGIDGEITLTINLDRIWEKPTLVAIISPLVRVDGSFFTHVCLPRDTKLY